MFAPMTLRTGPARRGHARGSVQPTTQSNSGGNQRGPRRRPSAGSTRAADARARAGRRTAASRRSSQSGSATASSSRKATISPRAAAIAGVARAGEARAARRCASTDGAGERRRRAPASSASLWSTTRMISPGRTVCARTERDRRDEVVPAVARCTTQMMTDAARVTQRGSRRSSPGRPRPGRCRRASGATVERRRPGAVGRAGAARRCRRRPGAGGPARRGS